MNDLELAQEAQSRINAGADPAGLVHLLREPNGTVCGLPTALRAGSSLSGYIETYYTLASVAAYNPT